jgi:hypothetical protein
MRTKTLLFTAAVVAAGAVASVAQSVYSVNAVGYVNVTLLPGFNLIANPLNGTNNLLKTIIPVAPNNSIISRWSTQNQGFLPSDTYFEIAPGDPANGWYDAGFSPSTTVINPGEGFFIQNPGSSATITFVGEVPQGPLTNAIGANFGFYSSIVPQSASLLSIGFPGVNNLTYTTWDANSQGYGGTLTYFEIAPGDPANGFYDGGFALTHAIPAVAQGFLIFNPGAPINWSRTFNVN